MKKLLHEAEDHRDKNAPHFGVGIVKGLVNAGVASQTALTAVEAIKQRLMEDE
jgi:hypothetical protein